MTIPIAYNEETGDITRVFALDEFDSQNRALQTNLLGEFTTGSITPRLLFGVDLTRTNTSQFALANFTAFVLIIHLKILWLKRFKSWKKSIWQGNDDY